MKPLLIIFHEATRTGSPRVLLDLLRHVRPTLGTPLAVRLLAGGPLATQLEELADVPDVGRAPAAVLINSSLAAASALGFARDVPIGIYVHEEGEALRTLPESAVRALRERCDLVWCVSESGRRDLEDLGVDPMRLSVLPPTVRVPRAVAAAEIDEVYQLLDLPREARLVVACGEASWRKGADLFLDVARRLPDDPLSRFVWVGRRPRAFARVLDHDARSLGVTERVRWAGELADPTPVLAAADVLLLTSREDPQPLVPLEAAMVGTPTVAFDIGGMSALGRLGAAATAPYPDTALLTGRARDVLSRPDRGVGLTDTARRHVQLRHSIDAVGDAFSTGVQQLLTCPTSSDNGPGGVG